MTTKGKLATLELIEGLFGWVSVLSFLATIVFVVRAIAFSGSWWHPLIAIAASAVSAWLGKGFHDSKLRVAFEAELVAQGFSPQEAARIWVERYMKA